jgi:hypothetical protein
MMRVLLVDEFFPMNKPCAQNKLSLAFVVRPSFLLPLLWLMMNKGTTGDCHIDAAVAHVVPERWQRTGCCSEMFDLDSHLFHYAWACCVHFLVASCHCQPRESHLLGLP